MAVRPENLSAEGGAAEAAKWQRKYGQTEGSMYNPVVHARVPGAGPKVVQWIGKVKAGARTVVRAERSAGADAEPVPLWFGDRGFVGGAPVDVALLMDDVGEGAAAAWPQALARTLERFPAAAGRLRQVRRGRELVWQIVCNNAGVPFTTASVPPCGLPSAEELHRVCMEDGGGGLFDLGEAVVGVAGGEVEEPLLRMKLIHEEGTARGVLGVSFHHALCDIAGLSQLLRWLHYELDGAGRPPPVDLLDPCHDRAAAQEVFDAVPEPSADEAAAAGHAAHWPLSAPALERWCFLARRLRSGMRGRPDGAATVALAVPAATLAALRGDVECEGLEAPTSFELLVGYLGLRLLRLGRHGRRVALTKGYRTALDAARPESGLGRLFANAVTHGLTLELPEVADLEMMPLAEACRAVRHAVDAVTLGYLRWQSSQDHYRGLPNFFGGLCCNSWGRALADLPFVESYAVGTRAVDERAANMAFPLDSAYMQISPMPCGMHRILLTMPISDITALLKDLPADSFELPHVSEVRTHAFRMPLPGAVLDKLCPTVATHHNVVRLACIGDSLTACGYPKYLEAMFDKAELKVQIRNFGVPGATAQRFSDKPYWDERRYEEARLWRPHFVISTLGTNDATESNWDVEAFVKDYADLCVQFLERLAPRPAIFLVVPPPVCEDCTLEVQQSTVAEELPAALSRVAEAAAQHINQPLEEAAKRARQQVPAEVLAQIALVDAFSLFGGAAPRREAFFAEDGVHPNERGTRLLATLAMSEARRPVARCLRRLADAAASVVEDNPLGL